MPTIHQKNKSGPGRVRIHAHNPAGTKLIKRFIKRARGENHSYREDLKLIELSMDTLQKRKERPLALRMNVTTLLPAVKSRLGTKLNAFMAWF